VHPFIDPDDHSPLSDIMSFHDFVEEVEKHEELPSR
jgi:hypothetical protein